MGAPKIRMRPKLRTLTYLFYVVAILLLCGWMRLVYLQVFCRNHLDFLSKLNFMRMVKTNAPRGNITDTYGTVLATNKPIFLVYWHGSGRSKLSEHQLAVIQQLSALLSFCVTDGLIKHISIAERYQRQALLAKDISFAQLSCVVEQLYHEPNIEIKSDFTRYYPNQELASHVIGYLSAHDVTTGKMGLEKICEDELSGTPGLKKCTVNAIGKALTEEEFQTGVAGRPMRTTIDCALQKLAEQAFSQGDSGCMLVMDPRSGALRVLLSRPSFDPDMFLKHISQEQWDNLLETRFFLNRACQACYPPASLFKLVTVAAALEQGIVTEDATRVCNGYYMFCNRPYHCNKRTGHGPITFKQSLAQSCNIIFFEIGKKINIDVLADYAHRFGLGEPTGVIFPEKAGLIPSSAWKRACKGERWHTGETLSVVVGQGASLVTPIQIARMLSAISEGYLVQPRILEETPVERKELLIQASTRTFLKRCMKAAIKHGTGQAARNIPDMTVYGKTGTAQLGSLEKSENDQNLREHGWFVAVFKYKECPPLTMVILVEHAGGSHVPVMVGKRFLTSYRSYMQRHEPVSFDTPTEPV